MELSFSLPMMVLRGLNCCGKATVLPPVLLWLPILTLAAEVGTDIIIDFTIGEDVIGLSGTMSFSDLILTGNNIEFGGQTLAILSKVNIATLTADDFIRPFLF